MTHDQATRAYERTRLETADRLQLTIMCYEKAIRELKRAGICCEEGDFAGKARHLAAAGDAITTLFTSLNRHQGGEIALGLASLYRYMLVRLAQGDLAGDAGGFDEVIRLLGELLSAWQEIAAKRKTRCQPADNSRGAAMSST
jgi:flagellar protein FliS